MKTGNNLLLWTDKPTAREHGRLLDQIQKWGFDGVEFPVIAMEAADIREMGKRCDDLGLKRSALLAYAAAGADPVSPDPKLRRAAADLIRRSIDKTRDIGADLLAGPIQQGLGRFTGSGPSKQEWSLSVEVIRQAGQHAAAMHGKLAVEPLNRFEMFLRNTISEAARFAAEVALPNVGVLADTHHSNIEEEQPATAWARAKDRISRLTGKRMWPCSA